jgi:hypothetical protein
MAEELLEEEECRAELIVLDMVGEVGVVEEVAVVHGQGKWTSRQYD